MVRRTNSVAEQVSIPFPLGADDPPPTPQHNTGILPAQELRRLVRENALFSTAEPVTDEQIQPASVDLRLGALDVQGYIDTCLSYLVNF